MKQFLLKNKTFLLLTLIIILGGFFRFYKLDWGDGLFAHPDEHHIFASVNQLSFPNQMHPHFFSYGTVTIYLIYFTEAFLSMINDQWSMVNIFLLGRFYSAFFSTLTILIVYKISRFFLDKPFSLLAAFLVAVTPGLIQQAHFTTPESNLIFFLFASLFFLLSFLQYGKKRHIFFSSLFLGFALGVKISALVFLLPFITGIILQSFKKPLRVVGFTITSIIFIFSTLAIVAPFVFLDFPAFWGNLHYEGNLAAGKIPVFYTRQFINTIPIFFQLEKIFPYTLGLSLLAAGILGFFVSFLHLGRFLHLRDDRLVQRSLGDVGMGSSEVDQRGTHFILILAFLSLFIPNAFLFAKWTRFIAPTFPFFAIFSAFLVSEIAKKQKLVSYILTCILVVTTSFWAGAFFTIYTKPDVRLTASKWLVTNTPSQSMILIEGGNMVDIPIDGDFKRVGFDFYTFEEDPLSRLRIAEGLEQADYFLVQSRRVFFNHQRARKQFPKTAHFYDMLFAEKFGFEEIKEFHQYPTLSLGKFSLEFPDEKAEETWSVFDHPVIRVFEKTRMLTKNEYAKIFEGQ